MVARSRKYLIRGGKLIDSNGVRIAELLVDDGKIEAIEQRIDPPRGCVEIDARDLVVSPGFVDLHTHLRQPGNERSETILSGSLAGVLGGYTALLAMPNTSPPIDSPEVVSYVKELSREALLDVYFAGAITKGRKGESLVEMGKLAELGIRLFTDDGNGVQDAQLMRRALEYARGIGVTLAQHCEDLSLANGGAVNEGAVSSVLGLRGIPNAAEDVMVARDIELVRLTGARMHFLHISTSRSAELVRWAKRDGMPITAEVTPHHLVLSEKNISGYNPIFKVNPPLRSEADRSALWSALNEDVFDAIATDHAPHHVEAKETTFDQAAFGMIGLQTALGAVLGEMNRSLSLSDGETLVAGGISDEQLMHLVGLLTSRPARIAGISDVHGGPLVEGRPANIAIFDPQLKWRLSESEIVSRSKNSPYLGVDLTGRVLYTIVNGELKLREGELCL